MDWLGDGYSASSGRTTVRIMFTTHAATGANVAPQSAFESADIKIYKNGSATQRTSANGITMTSPFDSIVGLHLVEILLTDNTDAGFYVAGSDYIVVLDPDETIDGLDINIVLGHFRIGPTEVNTVQFNGSAVVQASGRPEVNTTHFGGSALTQSGGRPEVNTTHAAGVAWASGAITAAVIATNAIDADALAADVATEINAGVLAVLGALADAAADGDPTSADTVMQYVKQLVNVLTGTAGIVTFPAAATPGNAVSLAEVVRQIYDEVAGLNGGALIDAAGIRTAIGLAVANLDTQLAAIAGYVDTEVAAILAQVDTEVATLLTELAKVPKSDSNVSWNATAAAQIQNEANDALVAYDPPTHAELTSGLAAADDATLAAIAAAITSTVDGVLDAMRVSKNTALANFTFVMKSSSDHVSGAEGLTVTAERSIDGGAFAACTNAVSEISDGAYKISFADTDLNGDVVLFKFTASGADPVYFTVVTQPKD